MPSSPLRLALLLLTLSAPAAAQTGAAAKPSAPAPAADTVAAPTAIPLSEVPMRAEAAGARLDEIRQVLPRDRAVSQIQDAYAATQDTIQGVLAIEARTGQEHPTKRSLIDMHNEWARRISQVKAWQKTVGDRTSSLSNMHAELGRSEATWRLTVAEAEQGNASADVVELAAGVLKDTRAVEDSVGDRLGEVIRLQSQIARTLASMQQADEQVNDQLALLRRDLLRLDAPPIWKAKGAPEGAPSLGATVRAAVTRTREELAYFFDSYRLRIYIHLASTLAILFGVYWFREKLEPHTTEQPAFSARRVLDHPTAGSALIIILATVFLYPRAPLSVYDLALLATVPPVMLLLPSFLPAYLVRPASICSVLFALQRGGSLLLSGSAYQRPGSLILSIVSAGGLIWLLRRGGELERLGPDAYAVALRVAARLSAATLLFAVASNVLGNVSLAQFLTGGVLSSTYLLLVLLAAVQVADGALIVWTRSRVAGTSRFVSQRKEYLIRGGLRFIKLAAAIGWVCLTLWLFELWWPTLALVQQALAASFSFGELTLSLGAALVFLTTIWVSVMVSRGISSLLEADVLSRLDMPRGLPSVIARLTRYLLIALGFFFALAAIGVQLTQVTIIGGALGVGIGFGLQNVVSNFVAGLILAFERPIREGDLIQLETLTGEVRRIGFRATIVRTYEGAEVIVPNASLISKDVVNWTLSDQQRRLSVSVGAAYGTDPDQVKKLLLDVVATHPSVLKAPEPVALFIGFGDSALNFEVRFWTVDADRISIIKSEVTGAINAALAGAGVEIPFPQRDLHLRSVDAPAAARLLGTEPPGKEPA
jgi:small-conductance mechanosensitive channel